MIKRLIATLILLSGACLAQNLGSYNGNCSKGGQNAVTQGLVSSGTVPIGSVTINIGSGLVASYPSCIVTVYPTGSSTPVPSNQIFSNNLSTPTVLGNPFTANTDGSFLFFAAAATGYDITMSGSGFPATVTLTDVVLCNTTNCGPNLLTTNNSWTGSNTWQSPSVFNGGLTATSMATTSFENVQYVDSRLIRGGADIVAEICNAQASLPVTGGEIDVAAPASGLYTVSSSCTFSKPVLVKCLGAPTPCTVLTTSTSLTPFVFACDSSSSTGNCGMENFRILGQCSSTTCSGVTNDGISIVSSSTNWFGRNLYIGKEISDPSVTGCSNDCGFLVGFNVAGTYSFAGQCINCSIFGSATGLAIANQEEWLWNGGVISQNAVPFAVSGTTGGLSFYGTHFDFNTSPGTQSGSTVLNIESPHFEGLGPTLTPPPYIVQTGGTLNISKGVFLEDGTSGSDADFISGGGSILNVSQTAFFSSGTAVSEIALLSNSVTSQLCASNTSPTSISATYNSGYTGGPVVDCSNRGGSNPLFWTFQGLGVQITDGSLSLQDSGTCTMSSGQCSAQAFGHTYASAPKCFVTWNNTGICTGVLGCTASTNQVIPTSSVNTDSCHVTWIVFGK